MRYRHVAVYVGDRLREAEEYYRRLFGMEVVLREGPLGPGGADATEWAQLPRDATWDDAVAAGVDLGMVALQRDQVILALFAAEPSGDRLYAVGMTATPEEIADVAGRLGDDEAVEESTGSWLAFVDRYGMRWQLSVGFEFRRAGDTRGMWLEV